MIVNGELRTSHDAHVKIWSQHGPRLCCQESLCCALLPQSIVRSSTRSWRSHWRMDKDRKAKWNPMVSTCFNMFQLRHRLMASYGILSLFCLRTLESLLPLRIAFLTLIPRHVLNQPLHIMKVSLWTAKKTFPTGRWPEYLHSFLAMPSAQDIAGQCVCPYVLQDHAQWNRHKPSIVGKAPREGRGIVVQDQQNPSTHLDSTVERGLARIVADLCFQLVLFVGIGTDPIGRLLRQLSQGGMTLQARHEIADRLQPSMRDKPQVECNSCRKCLHKIPTCGHV